MINKVPRFNKKNFWIPPIILIVSISFIRTFSLVGPDKSLQINIKIKSILIKRDLSCKEYKKLVDFNPNKKITFRGISASLLHVSVKYKRYSSMKCLISLGANVNSKDEFGFSPLHLSALLGDLKSGEILLRSNADVNAIAVKEKNNSKKTKAVNGVKQITPADVALGNQDSKFYLLLLYYCKNKHPDKKIA